MNEEIKNEEVVEESVNASEKPKKRKRKKFLIILILLIIAAAIGLFFGYQRLTSNPLSIYKKVINETYDLANNFFEENVKNTMSINLKEEPLTINTSFTLDTNMEELKALKNYEYQLSIGVNPSKEQMNLSLGLSDDNENILSLLLAFMNDRAYMKSDELYSKVLDLGVSEFDFSELQIEEGFYTYEDLDITLSKMKPIIINSLDSSKFSTSEETISVNGKEIKAKKFTYLLDQANMERTLNYIREEMIKDEELMNALSHIIGISTSDLENALKEDIDYSNYEDIYINLYTNGGMKVIAGNIGTKEEAVIRFTNQDDIFNMFIGDEYTNFTIKNENNITYIAYNEYDEEIFALTITWEENTRKIELTMSDYGDELNMIIEISNMKYSKNSISEDIVLKYNMNSYGEEINFELTGNMEITKEELENIDIENSVDVNTLSEEEALVFYENFMNVLDKLNLSTYFEI
mgnify:CR=1 FL=1